MTRPPTGFKCVSVLALAAAVALNASAVVSAADATSENNKRLKAALEKYPQADLNQDGILTRTEVRVYLDAQRARQDDGKNYTTDDRVLPHLAAIPKTSNGLWVASIGHSLVGPAMAPLNAIARDAGYEGHMRLVQIAGGVGGAPRAQWQRTGIMKPALALGKWDVMTMGIHLVGSDVEDFGRWIELGLQYNYKMIFYIQDAWPRLTNVIESGRVQDAADLELARYEKGMDFINAFVAERVEALNKKYGDKVFVIPVGNGMRELVRMHKAGKLPGIDAIYVPTTKEKRRVGLYRDDIHPSGPVAQLEGYIYFACIYKKNPAEVAGRGVKDARLDKILRQVAWKVATEHPRSGVK